MGVGGDRRQIRLYAAADVEKVLRSKLLGLLKKDQSVRERLNRLRDSDPIMRAMLDGLTDPHTSQIGVIEWTYPESPPRELRELEDVDRQNTAELREILQNLGRWPGRSSIGDDGAEAAWLVTLHADHDRSFQRQCLTLLREAAMTGNAAAWQVERFEDRLDVAGRRPPATAPSPCPTISDRPGSVD